VNIDRFLKPCTGVAGGGTLDRLALGKIMNTKRQQLANSMCRAKKAASDTSTSIYLPGVI